MRQSNPTNIFTNRNILKQFRSQEVGMKVENVD